MHHALVLSVRLHDTRYHGVPEWPPSPARLFQALVAGAAQGGALPPEDRDALHWLEGLGAPVIAAPAVRRGRGFTNYVPNNDLDAVGRDPHRVAEIRAGKAIRPLLLDNQTALLYAWQFDDGEHLAKTVCAIAERLYQLGRGVDMAWAWGEIIEADQLETRLGQSGRALYRPSGEGRGTSLLCPRSGSLVSLEDRFAAMRERFGVVGSGRRMQQVFTQPPKPHFAAIPYGSPPRRLLFELRELEQDSLVAWPLMRLVDLVQSVRDGAAAKLKDAMPDKGALIDRVLIGRGAAEADKAGRIRIIPLPSIGSPHVTRAIRRVLVEVPPDCCLPAEDTLGFLEPGGARFDDGRDHRLPGPQRRGRHAASLRHRHRGRLRRLAHGDAGRAT
jgi:CRISPR-associated protein Csb2